MTQPIRQRCAQERSQRSRQQKGRNKFPCIEGVSPEIVNIVKGDIGEKLMLIYLKYELFGASIIYSFHLRLFAFTKTICDEF